MSANKAMTNPPVNTFVASEDYITAARVQLFSVRAGHGADGRRWLLLALPGHGAPLIFDIDDAAAALLARQLLAPAPEAAAEAMPAVAP